MNANQKRLHELFREIFVDLDKYRREFPPLSGEQENWIVHSYDNPDYFVNYVELNHPSWEVFEKWLMEMASKMKANKESTERIGRQWADRIDKGEGFTPEEIAEIKKRKRRDDDELDQSNRHP